MEIKSVFNKGFETLKKYKYAALVLVIGLLLMVIPGNGNKDSTPISTKITQEEPIIDERLEQLLAQIDGAGKVHVMLTVRASQKTIYQTNEDQSISGESTNTNTDAVIITDSDRNQKGLIQQTISPSYQGAVIVCEGADDPNIRLAIVDAVSNLTGLGANQISVLKMK